MRGLKLSGALALAAIIISPGIGQARFLENFRSMAFAAKVLGRAARAQAGSKTGSVCDTSGKHEIEIACDYTEARRTAETRVTEPRIVLNRAQIAFTTEDENYMRVELTFTNESTAEISEPQTVYLSIDNDEVRNLVRRILPHVDFTKLEPGKKVTFTDQLLIGVLPKGQYAVHLWIPNADPGLKFDSAHNLLLSNVGVSDRDTGLNTIATFTILP
jgi:hypothetical protein